MKRKKSKFRGRGMQQQFQQEEKTCYFCSTNVKWIDYKDPALLRKFVSMQAKVMPTKRTGTCSKHQRQLAQSVKRARLMAILPYTINKEHRFTNHSF